MLISYSSSGQNARLTECSLLPASYIQMCTLAKGENILYQDTKFTHVKIPNSCSLNQLPNNRKEKDHKKLQMLVLLLRVQRTYVLVKLFFSFSSPICCYNASQFLVCWEKRRRKTYITPFSAYTYIHKLTFESFFRCASISSTYPCQSVRWSHFRISNLSASLDALCEKLKREDPIYFSIWGLGKIFEKLKKKLFWPKKKFGPKNYFFFFTKKTCWTLKIKEKKEDLFS